MANTYATIANGGKRADVHVIDKVTDEQRRDAVQYKAGDQAASPRTSPPTSTYAMQQVVQHGTGANAQALGRPAAGKTGTATNADDQVSSSWFVGYTPQLATAVMYVRGDGNDALDGLPRPPFFGAGYPTADLDRGHEAGPRGRAESRSSRRRRTSTATQPEDAPAPYAAAAAARRTHRRPTQVATRADDQRAADDSAPPTTPARRRPTCAPPTTEPPTIVAADHGRARAAAPPPDSHAWTPRRRGRRARLRRVRPWW